MRKHVTQTEGKEYVKEVFQDVSGLTCEEKVGISQQSDGAQAEFRQRQQHEKKSLLHNFSHMF